MNIAIIGLGYWGPNLVRNFSALKEVNKIICCDNNQKRLARIKLKYPTIETVNDFDQLLKHHDFDALIIATPVGSHYKFARAAMNAGKHVWVEKPFTGSSKNAEDLINISEKKNLKLFVDHTFIYTGAVRKIKELVDKGELGDVIYFDSVRINLGLFQHDVNVLWDLACHDLSIMNYILPENKIIGIAANGIANFYDHENIAYLSIYFENNCFAHIHSNWTSPVKIRRTIVGGKKKMLVFDDMENVEKIRVYDSGVLMRKDEEESIHEALVQYRIGDMYSPKVAQTEALALASREFIDSINEDRLPLTNGYDGLKIVRILEAADKSIKERGKIMEFNGK